jgi:MFS family permease
LVLAAFPLATGFWHLLTLNILVGAAYGLAFPAHVALAMENARGYGMGAVMSFLMLAHGVGMMIGPLLFGVIASHFGLGSAFWGGGIISALLTAICYPLARALPLPAQAQPTAKRSVTVAD